MRALGDGERDAQERLVKDDVRERALLGHAVRGDGGLVQVAGQDLPCAEAGAVVRGEVEGADLARREADELWAREVGAVREAEAVEVDEAVLDGLVSERGEEGEVGDCCTKEGERATRTRMSVRGGRGRAGRTEARHDQEADPTEQAHGEPRCS